mmetsp:Transcript_7269/g.10624  ORF Transcript_7269/g.10624 Transcript_7269/m.10624 type:complete len:516 (-) Transcript_7269:31-1578(-)
MTPTRLLPLLFLYLNLHLLCNQHGVHAYDQELESIPQWRNIGTIQGEWYSDFSGMVSHLDAEGESIAIHSFQDGTWFKGKTMVYNFDHESIAQNEWVETGQIEYSLSQGETDVSVAYSGDGGRIAVARSPFNVTIYRPQRTLSSYEWAPVGQPISGTHLENSNSTLPNSDGDAITKTTSVELSYDGNIVAISSYLKDGNGVGEGKVSILCFNSTVSEWQLMGDLISIKQEDDARMTVVSLSPDGWTVAIGSRLHRTSGSENSKGSTRVFRFNKGQDSSASNDYDSHVRESEFDSWIQLGRDLDGIAPGDYAGKSLALSINGDLEPIVAIGVPTQHGRTSDDSGCVRVFRYTSLDEEESGDGWVQVGSDLLGVQTSSSFGNSVQMSRSGSVLVIGVSDTENNQYVKVFSYDSSDTAWVQVGKDIISNKTMKNSYGVSLSLSDDGGVLAIGSPGAEGTDKVASGLTEIYEWNGVRDNKPGAAILVNSNKRSSGSRMNASIMTGAVTVVITFVGCVIL